MDTITTEGILRSAVASFGLGLLSTVGFELAYLAASGIANIDAAKHGFRREGILSKHSIQFAAALAPFGFIFGAAIPWVPYLPYLIERIR